MATPIIMPRQGQSVESCILTEWKVNRGRSRRGRCACGDRN